MNLTADQRRAIETIGSDLLVSAGAGSGKTSVLVSRCLHLITRAQPLSSVDRLLVVTFTDAAAAQLRSRIDEELNKHLAAHPQDRRVREQLALLDAASISTLHAFCKRVLTRHFAAAGVDPGFTLLDEHESDLLRDEAMSAMLDELLAERAKQNANAAVGRASSPDAGPDSLHPSLSQRRAAGARRLTARVAATPDAAQGTFDWDRSAAPAPAEKTLRDAFEELRHLYGAGRDDRIRAVVLSLYDFLGSLPDPENWLANVRARFSSLSPTCLTDEWRLVWIEALSETLADLHDGFSRLAADALADDATRRVGELAEQVARQIESWRSHVTAEAGPGQLDRILAQIRSYQHPRAPRTTEKLAHVEQAKKQLGKLREEFDKRLRNVDAGHSEADWAEGLSRIAPHVETILALEHRFAGHYAAAKRGLNALDFADLERRTLDLLRGSPKTTVWLRNWYEHVLVDEFQDINPIQNEILQCVGRAVEGQRAGNLFCVGDVKQSIYRFRLADPGIFTERRNRFCDAPGEGLGLRIDLSDNFRSRPPVLAAINSIMARLMTPELGGVEYDDRTKLRPGKTDDPPAFDGPPIELHLLDAEADARTVDEPDDEEDEDVAGPPPEQETAADWDRIEREAYFIARRIRLLREQDPSVHFRDIVILMRSAAGRLPLLVRSLQRLGIPVHAERSGGFFDAIEVRDMLAVLSLLDNARQDIPLAAVLRSPLCAFPQDGRRNLPLAHSDLVTIRLHRPGVSFHEAARDYALHGPDASLRELLSRLFARLQGWRESLRCDTLAELIAGIYAETNYPEYLAGQIDGPQRRANLFALHERARQFSGFSRQGLHRFRRYLEDLQDRDDDLAAGAPLSAAADVVRVMTIHRSKGLEFPFVFLVEAGKQFNPSDYSQSIVFDRTHGIGLKAVDAKRRITWPTLAHRRAARRLRMEGLSEELRLLYVAMTRAQRAVFIVGTAAAAKLDAFERGDERPAGPLPLSRRRNARSMLDWVLDAVAAEPRDALFATHRYRIEDIPASGLTAGVPDAGVKLLVSAAALHPLEHHSLIDEEAREAARQRVAMLDRRYAFEPLVAIPSVAAVTQLKHRWTQVADPDGELAALSAAVSPPPAEWRQPSARGRAAAPAPTERGLWTHLFLQHVDLSAACDAADLQRQLQGMVDRGLFRPDEAAHVGLDDIAWHLDQPLGRDLRGHRSRVQRELPFVLAVEPARYAAAATAADGGDFILVRGVIDCLYVGPDGLVIIDWKTDVVADGAFDERVALYRPQLEIYDRAARELLGQPVRARHLVFVNMRRVVDV